MSKKTPIAYYGGKQQMLPHILPLIPKHHLYCEPFCGGAAVFWAKEPSQVEVINDLNREVINFYAVVKSRFNELQTLIEQTLNSKSSYDDAVLIYQNPWMFDDVKRAWAFYVACNQAFLHKIGGGFGFDKESNNRSPKSWQNRKEAFTDLYTKRLELVSIECRDAVELIQSRDSPVSFFYCDPPYYNSDCGHYKGYTEHHFRRLLDVLASIKGKFLLSCYPSDVLNEYVARYSWFRQDLDKYRGANKGRKTEVLIRNYEL